nr:hypothetical protein [Tanacetum cinerariifolium]
SVVDTNVDAQSYEFKESFEMNHDTRHKSFIMEDYFTMIKVMIQKRFYEGMPLIFIIKNLYVPFGIPFDPKRFYKDDAYMKNCGGQERIYDRQVHRVHALDFDTLTEEMRGALADRLRMEHTNAQGHVVFTSHAWRRLFETRGPLEHGCGVNEHPLPTGTVFEEICFLEEMIDIDELVRLRICDRLGETWTWVASGPERKQDVAAEVVQVDQKGLEEGDQAILAPDDAAHAPPTARSRT